MDMLNEGKLDAAGAKQNIAGLRRFVSLKAQELQKPEVLNPVITKLDDLIALCQHYVDIELTQQKGGRGG